MDMPAMTPLEMAFYKDMIRIYDEALALGYPATRFKNMVGDVGGAMTAKRLLANTTTQQGFTELWLLGRLDLTVEAHVLKDKYWELFTDQERREAARRLIDNDKTFFQSRTAEYSKYLAF